MLLVLLAFCGASALIVVLPGPDTLVVVRSIVRHGRANAIRTVAGILCGLAIWVLAAALGLSAVLRASHDGYVALRWAGAAYLLWMGVQSLRARGTHPDAPTRAGDSVRTVAKQRRRTSLLGGGFLAGLATDLLNPKVGVFFVAFLPGFVPAGYDIGWFTVLLGSLYILETAIYCGVLLYASRAVTRWMQTSRIRRRVDRTTGVVLIGFAARLAIES